MVEEVEPISAAAASSATHVNNSTSITSEPDNAFVARRQAEITAAQSRRTALQGHGSSGEGPSEPPRETALDAVRGEDAPNEERLSGESERIGTGNWEEDVPPGEHVGYL